MQFIEPLYVVVSYELSCMFCWYSLSLASNKSTPVHFQSAVITKSYLSFDSNS